MGREHWLQRAGRWRILSLALAYGTLAASPSSGAGGADVVKDLKGDFGAKCDGVADDAPAFAAFHAWALAWQQTHDGLIELDVPAGVCDLDTDPGQWAS